jgi:hypothetical protein
MTHIAIKVSLSIADALKKEKNISGIPVRPMHPGATDEELESWYVAEVSNPIMISPTIAILNDSGMIQAAFAKPKDEAPK